MCKYKVTTYFTDLTDNSYAYNVGDEYPRHGVTVSEERINELASGKNKRGIPLIEKVVEKVVETEPINTPIEPKEDVKTGKETQRKRSKKNESSK